MFRIEYKIITERLEKIAHLSDEEVRYDFLMGNVSFLSSAAFIEMEWEWIPLLDFSYCLQMIVKGLKANDIAKEYFEFTENAETLGFLRQRERLRITASFSSIIVETTIRDFEKAANDFHLSISDHIRISVASELPTVLQRYLSIQA